MTSVPGTEARPADRPASPLRAALAAKTSLRTYHDIAVAPTVQVEAAVRQLMGARQLQVATLLSDDPAVREKAESAVSAAEAQRDACFHRIWFRGLGNSEFDALVALHPPTDDDDEDADWHGETFIPGLIAACSGSVDEADVWTSGDLSAEEWTAVLADEERWPAPERGTLIRRALDAQRQTLAGAVPKD